ncbi:MAG: hypothetical protein ACRDP4_13745 [Nocardioidaceae bacterium]
MAKAKSWAAAKAAHRNSRRSITIIMDAESAAEADRLTEELDRLTDEAQTLALAKRIRALEDKAADSAIVFVFQGVGRLQHETMMIDHPATAEQQAAMPEGQTLRWNPETYPPLLLAASCVAPAEIAGDVDEWTEIHRDWSVGQVAALWGACMAANAGVVDEAPKSVAVSDALSRSTSS